MPQYFIHDGQSQLGPFSLNELKSKTLTENTPIWYDGLAEWTMAGSISELRAILKSKSDPPPLNVSGGYNGTSDKSEKDNSYVPMMNQYFPDKKGKSMKLPLIITAAIIVIATIVWLINRNNENSETIKHLQNQAFIQTVEKEKQESIERAINERNTLYRKNWDRYITFSNSKPTVNYTFGGISAFTLTIKNQTEHILDQVDVQVKYIRKSGEIWQIKNISFLNVPANSYEQKIAPNSENGVEIDVSISKIVSRKMNFCFPINNGNSADPYFCK